MATGFLNCVVSIECGDALGSYQGQVSEVDNSQQTITIIKAFHNGIKCNFPKITINASDIRDMSILKSPAEPKSGAENPVVSSRTKPGSQGKHEAKNKSDSNKSSSKNKVNGSAVAPRSKSAASSRQTYTPPLTNGCAVPSRNGHNYENGHQGNGHQRNANDIPGREDDGQRRRTYSASEKDLKKKATTPRKMEGYARGRKQRDDCFSTPTDTYMDEFDFEKNLALFDKHAVFEEIEKEYEENGYPKIVRPTNQPAKYRCDENVLQSEPVVYRQIKMAHHSSAEFRTDTGLVVPSVSLDLRNRILELAEEQGLSRERQLEMIGRSASEMVMQLLGGSSRLEPKNAHQSPKVIVLCGPHMQGAYGVNCARHLAMHNVGVTVFVTNFVKVLQDLETELQLFQLTGGKKTSNTKDLPVQPIDMIVNCLDSHENSCLKDQQWYKQAVSWANQNKAPVLAVDPPANGSSMDTKWSLSIMLPLALGDRCGQLYLCDLAVPKNIFKSAGINYYSPFGHKFFIALRSDS